jgi:flagellin-like hook-associated protein FlgL
MSRIGATISGIEQYLLRHLSQVQSQAVDNSIRLATGQLVNSPDDDPAAFYLVSDFEHRLSIIQETKSQVELAAGIGAEMQIALDSVRTNLNTIRELLVGVQDGSIEDVAAAQTQIDAAIEEIDALAETEINGRRYLNGSVGFLVSGRNPAQVNRVDVWTTQDTSISGEVTSAATQATVEYSGNGARIDGDAAFQLTGKRGSATFSVTDEEDLTDVRDRINEASHQTGITASVAGDKLTLTSVDYGEDAIIDVEITSGDFDVTGTPQGSDALVTINGAEMSSDSVDGNRVMFDRNGTRFELELAADFTGTLDTMTVSEGPVARFALTPNLRQITQLALPGIAATHLGDESGRLYQLASDGSLDATGDDTSQAIRVVDEALTRLSLIEGRVDAFADVTVQSSSDLLDGFATTLENTLQQINGVDEEEESLLLAKNQALSANTLAAISILQQQRDSMVGLLQMISGLQA